MCFDQEDEFLRAEIVRELLKKLITQYEKKFQEFVIDGFGVVPPIFSSKKKQYLGMICATQAVAFMMATLADFTLNYYKESKDLDEARGTMHEINKTFWQYDYKTPIFKRYRDEIVKKFDEKIQDPENISNYDCLSMTFIVTEILIEEGGLKQIFYDRENMGNKFVELGILDFSDEIRDIYHHFEPLDPEFSSPEIQI